MGELWLPPHPEKIRRRAVTRERLGHFRERIVRKLRV
jgi:hypothetical protein